MIKKTVTTKAPVSKTTTTRSRARKSDTTIKEDVNNSVNLLSQIKIDIKHKNEIQKKLTQAIKTSDVTICTGPAGTGKSLLSVAEALLLLKNNPDKYHHIKLVKSITELKGESIGTLPGDANEKMTHIMMSFFDAFYKLIGEELTNKLLEAGYIKMEVFAAIRGRSFSNCIILVDEFQNITHDNAKTLLTRFSDDTKLVILGDVGQIDIKDKNESSLGRLIEKVKKNPMDGVNSVEFSENEIVRHRLTSYFINLFKDEPIKKVKQVVKKNKFKEFIDSIKAKFTL
jgi:phosphate starvation-inducible PhoH-like protein